MMENILKNLDLFICKYLGLDKQIVNPAQIIRQGNKLIVTLTESYKRHFHSLQFEKFTSENLRQLDKPNQKNFGTAMGKAIAKNLIVSFEDIRIKKDLPNVK